MPQAEHIAMQQFEQILAHADASPQKRARAAMLLVNLYESWDEPDLEATWRTRHDDLLQESPGEWAAP